MFSSNASQVSNDANYIEDVFSTYLYTGNDATQSIVNNIDLATEGGLTWIKGRSSTWQHSLFDTERGATKFLQSSAEDAETTAAASLTSFNTTGFSLGSYVVQNSNGSTYASWTFRNQPKFFQVLTYTGNGSSQNIAHNLGSTPGCIMVKGYSGGSYSWYIWHRGLPSSTQSVIRLNATNAAFTNSGYWNNTAPTSTEFSVGNATATNENGIPYVAYIFAHDAGGFGLTGSDNVISCGSYTGNGSTPNTVTLGYEPQWIMIKDITGSTNPWVVVDNMRGMSLSSRVELTANSTNAELTSTTNRLSPTATGFFLNGDNSYYNTNGSTYIYIAIRRGPMKVPTDGTKVFALSTWTGSSGDKDLGSQTANFGTGSLSALKSNSGVQGWGWFDQLRGSRPFLQSSDTSAEVNDGATTGGIQIVNNKLQLNTGSYFGAGGDGDTASYIGMNFRRAPSFFDEVCYTGTGANRTVTHNLGAVPELMLVKRRNSAADWRVYSAGMANTEYLSLNTTAAKTTSTTHWNSTTPTSSVFSLGTHVNVNSSGNTFVAYLFATCAGVSKVGSYTGTGTTLQVDCGFAAGARFVMIKRTDSTGDWYVWDTARGIVSGNDPYLLLNSTAAEATVYDRIDPYSAGFELSSASSSGTNASGGTYIYLAIA